MWLANQDQPAERTKGFFQSLSPDEQQRALRFHFERDRVRFTSGRGMLRRCLGAFLGTAADRVRFRYTEYGKPSLSVEFSSARINFNISHSGSNARFDVTLAPGEPARLLETRGRGLPASAWAMRSLDVGRGYKAALVVEGHEWRLKYLNWRESGEM